MAMNTVHLPAAAPPKPRVFVTRRIPEQGLGLVERACQTSVWPGELPPSRDELLRRVAGLDGLLCLLTDKVDEAVMEAAGGRLKVISNLAVGYDNVDVAAASRRGILVTHTPGVLSETTADFAFALLMAAARRIPEAASFVREGRWQTWDPCTLLGHDIHHATLGLVGLGRIGQGMARRARGFDMRVLYHDPHLPASAASGAAPGAIPCSSLGELLAESDFVSLHVPYGPATHHLIDGAALARMKPTAILVNTSRGAVVDTAALLAALEEGRIAGAALDVTDPEPLPPDHPLLAIPRCLVVPHIASASVATRGRMATVAAENLLAVLRGETPPCLVNPEALPLRRR